LQPAAVVVVGGSGGSISFLFYQHNASVIPIARRDDVINSRHD